MTAATFKFISDATGGDQFTVVSFSGDEAISNLYRYELEIKAPLAAEIELDDMLDSPARFITELDEAENPVYGVLSSVDELKTIQGYVHYRVILVPRLWWLSTYRTNEIYTAEETIDAIIQLVLENAGLASGDDFDLEGLVTDHLITRNYRCQFGESDLDFLSRLMENEGIFYYFDQSGAAEKIVFINDLSYQAIARPDLIFEVDAQAARQHDSISNWCCRKQRLPASITVRDYNPVHPSIDIADSIEIDQKGYGVEYLYGENIESEEEATYLSEIRAEERLCNKTRYYGEGSAALLHAGYTFNLSQHDNENYNGVSYLTVEVNHRGEHLDTELSVSSGKKRKRPQYQNSFVAIEAAQQFRPARVTPKPRFYGTMTAFIYAEADTAKPEVNEFGEYRVHLPFDRADGTKDSSDPNRKSSAWMRMAQPYVGQDQGLYFPLTGGTEVLLTFINGDPDQPVISAAIPNAAQPSLMEAHPAWSSIVTSLVASEITGNTHKISSNSDRLDELEGPPTVIPTGDNAHFINDGTVDLPKNMIPPWTGEAVSVDPKNESPVYDESLIKFKFYDEEFNAEPMTEDHLDKVSTERGAGDNYVYANARTFAYPQHERVYFIGTFHEDFHVKDDFADPALSWTGQREVFHFPAPGGDGSGNKSSPPKEESEINPDGIRGVSEDKRWGNQNFYAWGNLYTWEEGPAEGGVMARYNYKGHYVENFYAAFGGMVEGENGTIIPKATDTGELNLVYTYSTGEHNSWKTKKRGTFATRDYAELKDGKFIDPKWSEIEKKFGPSYDYHLGFAMDIHEGHAYAETWGDSEEIRHGNETVTVKGKSHSINGKPGNLFTRVLEEEVYGDKSASIYGNDFEFFLGAKEEIAVSEQFSFNLGAKQDINIGLINIDITTGGLQMEYTGGFNMKYHGGFGFDRTSNRIETSEVDIKQKAINLADDAVNLKNHKGPWLSRAMVGLHRAGVFLFN